MRRRNDLSLPFPFNVIFYVVPFLSFGVLALTVGAVVYAAYLIFSGSITPEAMGAFVGRIFNGFQEAR